MMKRALLVMIAWLCAMQSLAGQLTGRSQLWLHNQRQASSSQQVPGLRRMAGKQMVSAFIRCNDPASLRAHGVLINEEFGTLVTAWIPINELEAVAALTDVTYVDVAEQVEPCTDVSMVTTHTDWVHAGTNGTTTLDKAYHGEGVIVGVIDHGFCFNHPAFCDEQGNTRIKYVYDGRNQTELAVSDALTMKHDTQEKDHGTHVLGIAAGTIINGVGGMADKADIALGVMSVDATSVEMANCAKAIARYAYEQGKPCVINISYGSTNGAHDGSHPFAQVMDQLTAQYGTIFVVSSGNNGDKYNTLTKRLGTDGKVATLLSGINNNSVSRTFSSLSLEAWTRTSDEFKIEFFVYGGGKEYNTTSVSVTTNGVKTLSINNNTYGSGTIKVTTGVDATNNRFQAQVVVSSFTSKSNGQLGMRITGSQGQWIDIWCSTENSLNYYKVSGYERGNNDHTINSYAAGEHVLSVGSYVIKKSNNNTTDNDISGSSSYGYDTRTDSVSHPDICAPGKYVLSSYSHLDGYTGGKYTISKYNITRNGETYYYGMKSGTSMASPHVAGIIALWLERNPDLTTDQVRKLLKQTAITDAFTGTSPSTKWGAGKVNAWEAIAENLIGKPAVALAWLVDEGAVGEEYEVSGLTAVALVDGDELLICKDDGGWATPDVMTDPSWLDFMSQQGMGTSEGYDQSNWVGLRVPRGENADIRTLTSLLGKRLSGVRGTLTDRDNPELQLSVLPTAGEDNPYSMNTYIAASFGGTQVSPVTGRTNFLVRPKPMEYARIRWTYWQDGKFVAPPHVSDESHSWNSTELQGEFEFNGAYLESGGVDLSQSPLENHAYDMARAIVKRKSGDHDHVYVLGNVNSLNPGDWNTLKGVEMNTRDGVTYTTALQVNDVDNGYGYFSFSTRLGSTWEAINAYRFGADTHGMNDAANYPVTAADLGQELPLRADWSDGTRPFMVPEGYYRLTVDRGTMKLVITRQDEGAAARRRAQSAPTQYVVYPLELEETGSNVGGVITDVNNIRASRTVQRVMYYNAVGMVSAQPWSGVNIVVTRYSDGTMSTRKAVR